jgi:hypothetical protein
MIDAMVLSSRLISSNLIRITDAGDQQPFASMNQT